jgi:carbon storage regulator CsrA
MLVISRRCDQALRIGDDIQIIIGKVDRGRAVIKIVAPKSVPIDREEIWKRKHAFGPRISPDIR